MAESGNAIESSFQLLPITFSKSFEWPDELPKSIHAIKVDPFKLNLNDKPEEIQIKLAKALNLKTRSRIKWWRVAISTILLALATFFGDKLIKCLVDDRINENRVVFLKNSFEGRIATKIQPSFIIPVDERTSLQDSIYQFFELRDDFYHEFKKLPAINHSFVKSDTFSTSSLKEAKATLESIYVSAGKVMSYSRGILYNLYVPSNVDFTDLSKIIAVNSYLDSTIKLDKDINAQMDYVLKLLTIVDERRNAINHQIEEYKIAGKKTKEKKTEAHYYDEYMPWHLFDQMTILFEMTAQMCNKYLTVQWRDALWR